jgi:Ca-activated chloride channel family protein
LLLVLTTVLHAQNANNDIAKGNEAYRKGDYDKAIESYQVALKKDPSNTAARFNLANAQQKKNNIKEANKNYDEIVEAPGLTSLKAESNYNKALAFIKGKDLLNAIQSFKASLKENPNDDEARENLQKALNELKKQQQNKPKSNKQQQNPKQQKQPPLSKEMMQQKFNELHNQENQLQRKLQNKNNTTQPEKDW